MKKICLLLLITFAVISISSTTEAANWEKVVTIGETYIEVDRDSVVYSDTEERLSFIDRITLYKITKSGAKSSVALRVVMLNPVRQVATLQYAEYDRNGRIMLSEKYPGTWERVPPKSSADMVIDCVIAIINGER